MSLLRELAEEFKVNKEEIRQRVLEVYSEKIARDGNFVGYPMALFEDPTLKPGQRMFLSSILYLLEWDKPPSLKEVCTGQDISMSTGYKYKRELIERGYLEETDLLP